MKPWAFTVKDVVDFRERTGVGLNESAPLLKKWLMLEYLKSGQADLDDVVDVLIALLEDETQGLARYMKDD